MRSFLSPRLFALITPLLLLAPACTDEPESELDVATEYGTVRGVRGDGYLEWLGIPFAAPPVGDLRWRPPAPHPGWDGVLTTDTPPPACPQILPVVNLDLGQEDCLFINVHTPDPMPENAPVLVWIHGGGFTLGEGLQTDRGTKGDLLVQGPEDIVVVSMNYRLGALGFLAHPALSAESDDQVSGNYGFLDQVAALEWVRDNVAAFGGDPNQVTIAGESAGGMSVCAHMASPESTGLFDRAIIQSGPCQDSLDLAAGEAQGVDFAAEPSIACEGATDVAACMRAVPPADILAALPGAENFVSVTEDNGLWFPVYDQHVFPFPNSMAIANGPTNPVPLLVGFNGDEGSVFLTLGGNYTAPDPAEYAMLLSDLVDPMYSTLVTDHYLYDAMSPNNMVNYADAIGDQLLTCPARTAAMGFANYMDSWHYYFTFEGAPFQLTGQADLPLGAFHSAELQYVFGHPATLGQQYFTEADDVALHHTMRDYWVRFIVTGDPNGGGAPTWPEYDPADDTYLRIDTTITTTDAPQQDDCEMVWGMIPSSAWTP